MKAIQVQKTGGPEALTLVDLPQPTPKPNDAVVKIAAAGVNFIDVYFREGRYPAQVPFVDGQEAAGTVAAVGYGRLRRICRRASGPAGESAGRHQRSAGRSRHAAGNDGALPDLQQLSAEEGRDRAGPCRSRRSGAAAGADGKESRGPGHCHGRLRRESQTCPRGGRRSYDSLQRAGLRRGDKKDHRRKRRPCGL